MEPFCPNCRLIFEREEGSFLGSMALNYGVAGLAFIVVLVVWLTVDLPDVHTGLLMIASLATVTVVALGFYPFSKTIWAALDYLMTGGQHDLTTTDAAGRDDGAP
jgi:amino acid permease